ncbi:hypothetical protein FORC065_1414 [Yersinia enterocolitica]|nr:hypothetical protein FORC065_1414 [Yersinia enterocolitica]
MGDKNCGNNITDGVNSGQFAGGNRPLLRMKHRSDLYISIYYSTLPVG